MVSVLSARTQTHMHTDTLTFYCRWLSGVNVLKVRLRCLSALVSTAPSFHQQDFKGEKYERIIMSLLTTEAVGVCQMSHFSLIEWLTAFQSALTKFC